MIVKDHILLNVLTILHEFQTYRRHLVYIHITDYVDHILAIQLLLLAMSFFVNVHAKFVGLRRLASGCGIGQVALGSERRATEPSS